MNILEQNKEEIILMANEGVLYRDIAKKYNVSNSSISRFLRLNGIINKVIITEDMVNDILALYQNGETIVGICEIFNVGQKRISDILHVNGVTIRRPEDMNHKYSLNESYFDVLDNQNQLYIIGLLYADGCNTENHKIKISLQEADVELLHKVNRELGSNRPLRLVDYQSKNTNWQNQYDLTICNKHMSARLCELGVVPRKSLVLAYPDWMQDWMIPHFIRGYLDGDGCVYKTEKRVSMVGTTAMCEGIKNAVERELSIHCSISYSHNKVDRNTVDLKIAGANQVKEFLDYIYQDANMYMQRKYDLYKQFYK